MNKNYELKIKIGKELFKNKETGFSVIKCTPVEKNALSDAPTKKLVVVSSLLVNARRGDIFDVKGSFEIGSYGYSFIVTEAVKSVPVTIRAIVQYIVGITKGTGVGRAAAVKIVKSFDIETLTILDDLEKITDIIGEKKAKIVVQAHIKAKAYESILLYVSNAGVSPTIAYKLFEQFGDSTIRLLRADPYMLQAGEWYTFEIADLFGKISGIDQSDKKRVRGSLLYFLNNYAQETGHMYITKELIRPNINHWLDRNSAYKINRFEDYQIEEILNQLVELGHVQIVGENKVYIKSIYLMQQKIIKEIKRLLNNKDLINPIIDTNKLKGLATMQQKAVQTSLSNSLSIVTGGPGTGKTTTIRKIIECSQGNNIILLAPTGKAARRMAEATGVHAETIHKAINLRGDDESSLNEIDADLVIVDEFSMVSAQLLSKLLSCIVDGTRVVFVGDIDQLQAIGVGDMLYDLLDSKSVPHTKLIEIFRQAADSQIISNAYAVINNQSLTIDHNKGDFFFIGREELKGIHDTIIESFVRMSLRYGQDNVQVLSPLKDGLIGVNELNRAIQNRINPAKEGYSIKAYGTDFRLDDRVMQIENNYDEDVFNGMIGRVIEINKEDDVVVVEYDDEKTVNYTGIMLEQIVLAYAITVHKAQGSEFDCVIMPFSHIFHLSFFTSNLAYTGITRAKKCFVGIGEQYVLNNLQRSARRLSEITQGLVI